MKTAPLIVEGMYILVKGGTNGFFKQFDHYTATT